MCLRLDHLTAYLHSNHGVGEIWKSGEGNGAGLAELRLKGIVHCWCSGADSLTWSWVWWAQATVPQGHTRRKRDEGTVETEGQGERGRQRTERQALGGILTTSHLSIAEKATTMPLALQKRGKALRLIVYAELLPWSWHALS